MKKYCRDLELALIGTLEPLGIEAKAIDGLTGLWVDGNATRPDNTRTRADVTPNGDPVPGPMRRYPAKIASIGVHIHKWVTTHGYALNVDLDTAPFTEWITACGLDGASFTTAAQELGRAVSVDDVRPLVVQALSDVFSLDFEELPAGEGHGLWPQPIHASLART